MTDMAFRAMLIEAIADVAPAGVEIEEAIASDADAPRSVAAARSLGFLEGAAAALNLTVLELLSEFDLLEGR